MHFLGAVGSFSNISSKIGSSLQDELRWRKWITRNEFQEKILGDENLSSLVCFKVR